MKLVNNSQPKSKAKSKEATKIASAALFATLSLAEKLADAVPVPGVKAAVGGLLEIVKVARKTEDNASALIELDNHLLDLSEILNSIKDDDGKGNTMALRERIEKLTNELQRIVNSSGKIRSQNRFVKMFSYEDNAIDIATLNKSIDRAIQAFQVGGNIAVEQATTRIEVGVNRIEGELSRMGGQLQRIVDPTDPLNSFRPYIADAAYDSATRSGVSRCFQDTRTQVLQKIYDWAESPTEKPMYWLCGLAGTGKSTIAQTVAEQFKKRGQLGASFFFSRDVADRTNPDLVFTSIAYQLGRFNKTFCEQIAASLKRHPDSPKAYLKTQLEDLIIDPLKNVTDAPPVVILVIDALDECSDEAKVEEMLILLASAIHELPFDARMFITSRPDIHIRTQFTKRAMRAVAESSFLHDIEIEIVQHDIGVYVRHHLQEIAESLLDDETWPGETEIGVIIDQSRGLFIYASAAIAYVGDRKYRQPKQRLKAILDEESFEGENPFNEMDKLYRYILRGSLPAAGSRGLARKLQAILAATVLLLDPLPAHALETLLSLEKDSVWPTLIPLHSVLSISRDSTKSIRVFHKSFQDFLVDPRRCTDPRFLVQPEIHRRELVLACLYHMNKDLRRNMCDIQKWWTKNGDIVNLSELLGDKVGPHLLYACRHWAAHLEHISSEDAEVVDAVRQFSLTKLPYWLEVLSLSGQLLIAVPALIFVQKWYPDQTQIDKVPSRMKFAEKMALATKQLPGSANHSSKRSKNDKTTTAPPVTVLLQDCWRLVRRHFEPISLCAAQIYQSALPMGPICTLHQNYADELLGSIRIKNRSATSWDPTFSVLQGHTRAIMAVAFSADGSKVATASDDGTVQLWDSTTGIHIQTLTGHSDGVTSVAFSPDGTRIASASMDKTIQLWDSTTGARIQTLDGASKMEISTNTIPYRPKVTTPPSSNTLRLWDSTTGTHIQLLEHSSEGISSVVFSPDGSKIATASCDKTVQLWNSLTGDYIRAMEGHTGAVSSVFFSPDGSEIASASHDKTVRLWNPISGACICALEGHKGAVTSVVYSPDGTRVASASDDATVRVWSSATGVHILTLEGHAGTVTSVAFSSNGSKIASASEDKTIRIWNADTGAYIHTLLGHSGTVTSVVFSADGSKIATASFDKTARIRDATDLTFIPTKEEHDGAVTSVAFSPDGSKVVSTSHDKTVQLRDSTTGALIWKMEGHTSGVLSVAYSPDGSNIASTSLDKTVRIWDPATGALVHTLDSHTSVVTSLAFSSDGSQILSLDTDDGSKVQWDITRVRSIAAKKESVVSHKGEVSSKLGYQFVLEDRWIIANLPKEKIHICYLPLAHISCHAFFGQTVVIGTYFGAVFLYDLSHVVTALP